MEALFWFSQQMKRAISVMGNKDVIFLQGVEDFCTMKICTPKNANRALTDNHCLIAYINHLLLFKELRTTFSQELSKSQKYHINNHRYQRLLFY